MKHWGPIVAGLGALVGAALWLGRRDTQDTEVGAWYRDGRSQAPLCVRCGRRLKRPGVRLVSTDDPTVSVAAGPRCATRLEQGATCDSCDRLDDLPPLPTDGQPDCCRLPYKEWSAAGKGGITYGEAADAVYADSFGRSRRGEGSLTVSHGRIVKTIGRRKRQVYADCRARYCDTAQVGNAYAHHRGNRYEVTRDPDASPDHALVVSRRGVATATYQGATLYEGDDLAAALQAASEAVSDPWAGGTYAGPDVPF